MCLAELTGDSTFQSALVAGILALGIAGCSCLTGPVQPKREVRKEPYPLIYAVVPPQIDGRLDDQVWERAEPLTRFYTYKTFGEHVDICTAYMAWDKDNLYLGVDIKDKDLYVADKDDDAELWLADVAELFVKPREGPFDLYEFEFNMWNALWDIHYIGWGGGGAARFTVSSDTGIIVKSTHKGTINDWEDVDEGWSVEVAIPLKAFARAVPDGPKAGDRWRFNVAGYDYSCYREKHLLFTSCDGNLMVFAEYKLYPEMEFMPPE